MNVEMVKFERSFECIFQIIIKLSIKSFWCLVMHDTTLPLETTPPITKPPETKPPTTVQPETTPSTILRPDTKPPIATSTAEETLSATKSKPS